MAIPCWLKRILDYHGAPYKEHQHPPVHSASELAHAEHVSGHRVCKTVLLAARGRPVAVALPASARLDLDRVQAVLACPDLRLATEAEIAGWFKGCQPGAVPPLRLRSDQQVLMDRSLAHLGDILFPAGAADMAVSMRFRDWYRMARPGCGRFAQPLPGREKAVNGPARVLVIEDENDTQELLCRFLEREGFVCRGVAEGNQALALAAQEPPSAILLDLMLPDMSGFEVYDRLLRQARSLRHTPVIVVTALDDEASRQRGQQLGADAYLTKPFRPEALVAELQGALADALA